MLARTQLLTLWSFGLISGFTLMMSGNTLNYWLAKEALSLRSIGIFSLILLPYSINFLWAPLFDTLTLGWLGRKLGHRASWIGLIQLFLAISLTVLSLLNPTDDLLLFAVVAFIIAFLSSAQDAVLGAVKTEIISRGSQGAASGIYIFGYRIGMLLAGSGAIYLSAFISWNNIYRLFALSVMIYSTLLMTLMNFPATMTTLNAATKGELGPSPLATCTDPKNFFLGNPFNLFRFIQSILKPVGPLSTISLIIAFLMLYRLPDNFISTMINPFLIHLGYDEVEIASCGKFFGVVTIIIGGFIASHVMKKKNILESLLLFGVLHALAHILFVVQEIYGRNLALLFIMTGFESITGGMAMAAYIAFIASLCSGKFRATQYAFFSSVMGFSRAIFPAFSGYIVTKFGWKVFFTGMTFITLPSLLVLLLISSKLRDQQNTGRKIYGKQCG